MKGLGKFFYVFLLDKNLSLDWPEESGRVWGKALIYNLGLCVRGEEFSRGMLVRAGDA